jgi:two-component system, LytTR family, sensor kinase
MKASAPIAADTGSAPQVAAMPAAESAIPRLIRPLAQFLYKNRNYRFWFNQLVGWTGYSLATFLSITLVENNVSWPHIGHISLSAVLGMLCTWPLRLLYRHTFGLTIATRTVVALIALVALSGIWTMLRILVFAWILGVPAIWNEFHYWYFGSLSVFLSWTALYYGIKYYELLTAEHEILIQELALKKEEQYKRALAESSARDAQLRMLRYQLNPHFLFNTLNAINSLVQLGENSKAQEMLVLLSEFLRHSLEHAGLERVSLEDELESLMLYLNIEKVRFEDRLTLEFDIAPQASQALVPGLILQPILENSMKYAVGANEDGGKVRITARVLQGQLQLEVSDTGPGMDAAKIADGRGVGLRNTLERLETMYENSYSFEAVETQPSGLTVRLRIPFQTETTPQNSGHRQEHGLIV